MTTKFSHFTLKKLLNKSDAEVIVMVVCLKIERVACLL